MAGKDEEDGGAAGRAEVALLRAELAESRAQTAALTKAIADVAASNARLALGARRPVATITIAALFEEFTRARRHEHSWRWIRAKLEPLVRRLGDRRAADLAPLLWTEHFAARRAETSRRGQPPAIHSLNIELGRAKELLDFGVQCGLLTANPLTQAKREKTISARETWTGEDGLQRLLDGTSVLRDKRPRLCAQAFMLVCFDAMLRFNEARRIRRDRISREGVLTLSARETKSRKERVLALTPRCIEALARVPPVIGSPFVFANPETRELYGEQTMRYWFRQACIRSGLDAFAAPGERFVPHSLRHSGASAADARGASAKTIKEALGHASLATTERYLHRHKEEGAKELARLMARGTERERRGPQRAAENNSENPEDTKNLEKLIDG